MTLLGTHLVGVRFVVDVHNCWVGPEALVDHLGDNFQSYKVDIGLEVDHHCSNLDILQGKKRLEDSLHCLLVRGIPKKFQKY